jgi:hypothetical protein
MCVSWLLWVKLPVLLQGVVLGQQVYGCERDDWWLATMHLLG